MADRPIWHLLLAALLLGTTGLLGADRPLPPPPGMGEGAAAAAITTMDTGVLDREEVERLLVPARTSPAVHGAFALFDADGDGKLSRKEWLRFVRDPGGIPMDLDGDGLISKTEFVASVMRMNQSQAALYEHVNVMALWGGKVADAHGNLERAVEQFVSLATSVRECFEAFLGAGRSLMRSREFERAREMFLRAVGEDPSYAEAWLDLAVAEDSLGQLETAREHVWRGLRLLDAASALRDDAVRRGDEDAYVRRVIWRLKTHFASDGRHVALVDAIEDWARGKFETPPVPQNEREKPLTFCEIAELVRQGRFAEALSAADRAVKLGSQNWEAHLARAGVQSALGRPAAARQSLEAARQYGAKGHVLTCLEVGNAIDLDDEAKLAELLRKLEPATSGLWACIDMAWQLGYRDRWWLAKPWLERGFGIPFDQQRTGLMLAMCRHSIGDVKGAASQLGKTVAPLMNPTLLRVGSSLCLKVQDIARALDLAEEAVRINPQDLDNWLQLAKVNHAQVDLATELWTLQQAREAMLPDCPRKAQLDLAIRTLSAAIAASTTAPPPPNAFPEPTPLPPPDSATPATPATPASAGATPTLTPAAIGGGSRRKGAK